jgi:subtilisin family serine protease
LHPAQLAAFVLAAAPIALPDGRTPSPIDDGPSSFVIVDGGAPRVVVRGSRPGDDAEPASVRYVDPVTGRSTLARVGRGAIVQLPIDGGGDVEAATRALRALGLIVVRPLFAEAGLWLVQSPVAAEDGVALAARLASDGVVGTRLREAFPDLHLPHRLAADDAPDLPPDDPRYAGQWYLDVIGIEDAWLRALGSPDTVIAVVDNGCDTTHPDLAEKLDPGHDVVDDDDDPTFGAGAGNEHGTACAGLVAALTDNGVAIAGTCPLCRATCTRLLGGPGDGVPLNADVRAFGLAFDDDVDVVSNSWGFVDAIPVPQVLAEAITFVQQNGRGGRGAVVAFASGNDNRQVGDDELLAVPGVLGVGAVNNFGELTQFSNRGRSVDVVAPTGTITTDIAGPGGASAGDVTATFGGTSSACPLVAGIAGLIVAAAPDLTADELNALLASTAEQSVFATPDEAGHDLAYGFGLVQPRAALDAVLGDVDVDGNDADDITDEPATGCASTTPVVSTLCLLFALAGPGLRHRRAMRRR